jgi:hypothetical protein
MKRAGSLLTVMTALTLSGLAQAQGVDEFGAFGRSRTPPESPQNVAFEARFGRYYPNVDDEFDGPTPFQDIFGTDNRYLLGVEIDWQALTIPKLGTLGPGFGIGYTKLSGKGFVVGTTTPSSQVDTLAIVPMYVVGVLRADVIAKETPVPVVPYAKAGLGAALWWSKSGDDTARDDDGNVGRDISYGYQFALGAMLLLDVFEPDAAVEMDVNTGVNNSYFFLEWYLSNLDGFGGNKMQVGTNTWMLGLAFEI